MAKIHTPRQQNWIWYQNNAIEPTIAIGTENTKPTLPDDGIIRLRVSIAEIGDANGSNVAWGLEYSLNESDWVSFGAANHWNYANGLATEGNTIAGHLTSDGSTLGLYYESGTFNNLLGKSTVEECDFAIQPTGNHSVSTTYYFRVIIGGAEVPLNTGETHPQVVTFAGANQVNFADTLALSSLTSTSVLFKSNNFADTLALASLTSDAKLHLIKVFADTLDLTSLTSTPNLSGFTINFADTLALTSLTSIADLFKQNNFSDTLDLTSLTSDVILTGLLAFSDTLALTSLTSTPNLSKIVDYIDALNLTSLTSDAKLYLLKTFVDTLNLTSLTSAPNLSGFTIDFADTLDLTSLTSDVSLRLITVFSDTLNLTSNTSNPTLFVGTLVEMYRWTGTNWEYLIQ